MLTAHLLLIKGIEHRSAVEDEVVELSYYGGAKGQVLQLRQKPDGSVTSEIIPEKNALRIKGDKMGEEAKYTESFETSLTNIHQAASALVGLQERVKNSGKLSAEDKKLYLENLQKLGISAQELAFYQTQTDSDDFKLLFENPFQADKFSNSAHRLDKINKTTAQKINNKDSKKKVKEEEKEENVGEEVEPSGNLSDDSDSVLVETPEKDAPVAEAKPVGLAIAGAGGVASSKPVATAVVGPGGLAIARPVATAIAGVSPSEISSLNLPIKHKIKSSNLLAKVSFPLSKKKYGLAESPELRSSVLVGPEYVVSPINAPAPGGPVKNGAGNANPNPLSPAEAELMGRSEFGIAPESLLSPDYPMPQGRLNPDFEQSSFDYDQSPIMNPYGFEGVNVDALPFMTPYKK